MNSEQHCVQSQRSMFVTVVAWIFIAISAFCSLTSTLQNIMLHTMLSEQGVDAAVLAANQSEGAPFFATFMVTHMAWFAGIVLVVSLTLLSSSVGLLKRKNWARWVFVGVMALGIAWNIVGFVMQIVLFSSFPGVPSNAPAEFQEQFRTMSIVMGVFGQVMALGLTVLFGWIIKRLLSKPVALEFGARA